MPDFPIGQGPGFVEHINDSGTTTIVTNGAVANVKGAYVTLVASTAYDMDGLLVLLSSVDINVGGAIDIAVGAAASEQIIAADLGWTAAAEESVWFHLPIGIPAGTRISARSQSNNVSRNFRVQIHAIRGGLWGQPSGGAIETLGWVSGTSTFTAVDAGAVANTFGAWTQITAATTRDICALRILTNSGGNTPPTLSAVGASQYQIAIGAAASEVLILGPIVYGTSILNYGQAPSFWLPTSIPGGSRVAVRTKSATADATDRITRFGLYGLCV